MLNPVSMLIFKENIGLYLIHILQFLDFTFSYNTFHGTTVIFPVLNASLGCHENV